MCRVLLPFLAKQSSANIYPRSREGSSNPKKSASEIIPLITMGLLWYYITTTERVMSNIVLKITNLPDNQVFNDERRLNHQENTKIQNNPTHQLVKTKPSSKEYSGEYHGWYRS